VFLLVLLISARGRRWAFITATSRAGGIPCTCWRARRHRRSPGSSPGAGRVTASRQISGFFFQVTSSSWSWFALQLLLYSFHEANRGERAADSKSVLHIATEPYGPEGNTAHAVHALVLLPGVVDRWVVFGGNSENGPAVIANS